MRTSTNSGATFAPMPPIRRRAKSAKSSNSTSLKAEISARLKSIPEQQNVVGPLVPHLVALGWSLEQIMFGKHEWRVPKSPSEATKRERGLQSITRC
jgi:hypothetical protein